MKKTAPKYNPAEIRKKIYKIERLAAMPQVVYQLMNALADGRASGAELERIIESDLALTSKLLSLSNSAYYGLSQKITTIKQAVMIIGLNELEYLTLGIGLARVFDFNESPRGFDGESLWHHCLAASWCAKELAEIAGRPNPGEAMISGLLHDLGKLVLATHLTEEFGRILEAEEEGDPYYLAEESLGLKHSTLGYWLALRWSLPRVHASAIRDHHLPLDTDPDFLNTSLVFLADHLVKELNFGLNHEARQVDPSPMMTALGLSRGDLEKTADRGRERLPQVLESWRRAMSEE